MITMYCTDQRMIPGKDRRTMNAKIIHTDTAGLAGR
jgi:hypothetical protein